MLTITITAHVTAIKVADEATELFEPSLALGEEDLDRIFSEALKATVSEVTGTELYDAPKTEPENSPDKITDEEGNAWDVASSGGARKIREKKTTARDLLSVSQQAVIKALGLDPDGHFINDALRIWGYDTVVSRLDLIAAKLSLGDVACVCSPARQIFRHFDCPKHGKMTVGAGHETYPDSGASKGTVPPPVA